MRFIGKRDVVTPPEVLAATWGRSDPRKAGGSGAPRGAMHGPDVLDKLSPPDILGASGRSDACGGGAGCKSQEGTGLPRAKPNTSGGAFGCPVFIVESDVVSIEDRLTGYKEYCFIEKHCTGTLGVTANDLGETILDCVPDMGSCTWLTIWCWPVNVTTA